MIGSTSAGTVAPVRSPTHGSTRIAIRYATPAATSVTSGAPNERNARPTMTTISATLPASTIGSAPWISSYCASRAGAAPVTPTTAPSRPPR